jgi:hypothetical protein
MGKTKEELAAETDELLKEIEEETCESCGGEMQWCYICNCYTMTCCVSYGTCACS